MSLANLCEISFYEILAIEHQHRAAEITLQYEVKQISQSSTYLILILNPGKRKVDPKINESIKC